AAAGIDDHGDVVAVVIADLEPRVVDCLARGGHRELGEAAHAPRLLEVDPVPRAEALHLGRDANLLTGGVERRDGRYARDAAGQVAPERLDVVADGGDGTEAGHDGRAGRVTRARISCHAPRLYTVYTLSRTATPRTGGRSRSSCAHRGPSSSRAPRAHR